MRLLPSFAFFFLFASAFAQTPVSEQPVQKFLNDTLISVAADTDAGFAHEYLLFIPRGTAMEKKTWLLVEPNNSGYTTDSIEKHRENAVSLATTSSIGNNVSTELKIPFLVPVFPRPQSQALVYTHALDRDALVHVGEDLERLDLQLLAMIKDAGKRLRELNVTVEEKILLNGFSASGSFVNRFAFLHPEMVKAVAAGGFNGILMIPRKELKGHPLPYPLGIQDLQEITGSEVDLETYKMIPQFYYMGALDENDAVLFNDAYNDKERETIYATLGSQMQPNRWEKIQQIYREEGVNVKFRTFPDVGHWSTGEMNLEVIKFFMAEIRKTAVK